MIHLPQLPQLQRSQSFLLSRFSQSLTALSLLISLSMGCTSKPKDDVPNTVRLATPQKIQGLDPALSNDLYANDEIGKVYETLLEYHYLKRPYQLKSGLAEAMPVMTKDGKVYTFKIKKGILFQDDPCFSETQGKGREMVAEDVVYSWKRLADPKLASTGWWIFDGKIAGLNEWRGEAIKSGKADYSKSIEGLRAIDKYTLQVKLTQRSGLFKYFVAMPFASVIPHEAVEHYGAEFLNHPVGTGPFRLVEYNPASKLVWIKNPTYRKELYPSEGESGDKELGLLEDANQPLPRADKIIVQVFEESQPMWLNFKAGKVDATAIPKDNFAQAITPGKDLQPELKSKGISLQKAMQLDITHTSFNMADPLFSKNKLLRQALSLAYNQEEYNEYFYSGQALAAQGPIPPGLVGYDEKLRNPYRQYNLAKAKELLAKAGYPNGQGLPILEYNSLTDTTSRQSAEYMQKAMNALGVKIKINSYSWPEFLEAAKQRRGQIWSYAWAADYPDAENFLQLFYSKNVSPGPNDSNYNSPDFDKLYEKALLLNDSPERTALYKKMVEILVEDAPWIFGAHRMKFVLKHPWIKGYKWSDVDHTRFKYMRVDPSLKK